MSDRVKQALAIIKKIELKIQSPGPDMASAAVDVDPRTAAVARQGFRVPRISASAPRKGERMPDRIVDAATRNDQRVIPRSGALLATTLAK